MILVLVLVMVMVMVMEMETELIAQLKGTFYGTTFFDECSMKKVLCVQIANAALCLK